MLPCSIRFSLPTSPSASVCDESLIEPMYQPFFPNRNRLIEQLMDDTFKATNPDLKVKLALLEKKARELLAVVRERLGVYN